MSSSSELRLPLAAAVATLLTALTLQPVIQGTRWLAPVAAIIIIIAITGAAMRQVVRWWPVVLLAQAAVGLLTVTFLYVRDEAIGGLLPGSAAWRAMGALGTEGLQVIDEQAAPVEAPNGLVFATVVGIGIIALTVDFLSATMRRPATAGLPLLAVYCVPAAVVPGGLQWHWFALAAAGYLLLVGADAAARVRSWGRVLSTQRGRRQRSGSAALWPASGGGRAAASAVALAVLLPLMIPGLRDSVIGGSGIGGDREGLGADVSVINPILDLRRDLSRRSNEVALRYRTTVRQPQPLRLVADEIFDGEKWAPARRSIPAANRVQNGLPGAPGLADDVQTEAQRTTVTIGGLDQNYLPLPYPATRVDIEGTWLYDTISLNVLGRDVRTRGTSYTVDHLTVAPTIDQLTTARPPSLEFSALYTRLPRDVPAVIRETASRVAGTGTAYQQAVRLQQWFRSGGGFVYSIQAPGEGPDDSGLATMTAFLDQKRGYCVHFASAMALMARTLGIPSRVAVGFLPGQPQGSGEFLVTFADAHAWPELYFDGVGWVRFEPTPSTQSGVAPAWTVPPPGTVPDVTADATQSAGPVSSAPSVDPEDAAGDAAAGDGGLGQSIPWRWLAALSALGLLAFVPMTVAATRRRARWRRATSRVAEAEAAWEELRERLADLQVTWPSSRTPRAIRDELAGQHDLPPEGAGGAALQRLVTDLESARYARPGSPGRPTGELVRDVRATVAAVAAGLPPAARRRARWLPRAGLADGSPTVISPEPDRVPART